MYKIKIATPISSLFTIDENIRKIKLSSDCFEGRDRTFSCTEKNQEVYHSEIQPIFPLTAPIYNHLLKIKNDKRDLKLISFHMASCCEDVQLSDKIYYCTGKMYSKKQMINNAHDNFCVIKKIFGKNIEVAVENNNYYKTNAYQIVSDGDFISEIVVKNNIKFLFDIAHAKVTCFYKKISYLNYKKSLPMQQLIQIHLSGCGIGKNNLLYDNHLLPSSSDYQEVKKLCKNYSVNYVTLEYYNSVNKLIQNLKLVRRILDSL